MAAVDSSKYAHSPVHKAVITKDYTVLGKILAGLPRLCDPAELCSESVSLAEEVKADTISGVIDRRDVQNRDTPLHLAVKLGDEASTEMLMVAGADWSLKNDQGWSALQEAIRNREEKIAMIIVRHKQPLAWAKWCRKLPRLTGTMRRMRDFYMEITFHFESSMIPFISRIAPSDTYKIWKRGANLRVDLTLAGFDGFKIKRSDRSVIFMGDGFDDGKVPPGSLCMILHEDKEVISVLNTAGSPLTEEEVRQKVAAMSQRNISRTGIDVTQAVLFPQLTWRRQEKTEMVGSWKAKVYEMHNIVVSIKSRAPGAVTDDEFFSSCNNENKTESEKVNNLLGDSDSPSGSQIKPRRRSMEVVVSDEHRRARDNNKASTSSEAGNRRKDGGRENENKKGLRPILWLSLSFPLQMEELLPLLDILAKKVEPIRRLREMLTTKFPAGTFPVKVAIPVVPTISVIVTFTKFEELEPVDEFATPPSSATVAGRESPAMAQSSSNSSWFQWIKAPHQRSGTSSCRIENIQDPFMFPPEYTWITLEAAKKKRQEKNKSKKKNQNQ